MLLQCSDVTFSCPLSEHYYLLLVHNGDPIVMNCDALTYFMFAGKSRFIAITLERDGVIY